MINKLLVKNILEKADQYNWTLQGLGMLRLYLSDEVRLHVWDDRYKVPNVSALHDHPWDFESTIIAGAVNQYRYDIAYPFYGTEGLLPAWMVTIKCGVGAEVLTGARAVFLHRHSKEMYVEGDKYTQRSEEIHESLPLRGTVTIVERKFCGNRENARVFYMEGSEWVSAEPRPATREEVRRITEHALARWF